MYWITQWFYPSLQTTQSLFHSVGFTYYIISRHKLLQLNILKSIFRLTLRVLQIQQILLLHNTHMCWISTIYHRGYGMAYQWSQCQGQVSLMYRVMHNHRITPGGAHPTACPWPPLPVHTPTHTCPNACWNTDPLPAQMHAGIHIPHSHPVDKMTDTRLWKHYLPATSFVGGNNKLNQNCDSNLPRHGSFCIRLLETKMLIS